MRLKWKDGIQRGNRIAEYGAYTLVTWPASILDPPDHPTQTYGYTIYRKASPVATGKNAKSQRLAGLAANRALQVLLKGQS